LAAAALAASATTKLKSAQLLTPPPRYLLREPVAPSPFAGGAAIADAYSVPGTGEQTSRRGLVPLTGRSIRIFSDGVLQAPGYIFDVYELSYEHFCADVDSCQQKK
jgi:hypothetical protein